MIFSCEMAGYEKGWGLAEDGT